VEFQQGEAVRPELLASYVDILARVIDGVCEPILSLGEIEPLAFDSCLESIRDWGQRPNAAYRYAVSWAEGRRPESE